jgi:hypothetical protein
MADYFSQRFDNLVLEPFEWDRDGQRRPELDDFSPSCKDVLGMLYRADAAVPGGRGGKGPLLFRAVISALADRTPETYESFAEMGRNWQDKCDEAECTTKDLKQVNELFTLMDSPALDQEQKAKLHKCFDPHCSARLCLDSCRRHYGPRARPQHVAVAAMVLMAQQSMAYAEESLSAEVAERRGRNATFLSSVKELEEGPCRERDAPINGSARVMCAFTRYLESYRSKTGTKEAKRRAAAALEPQHLGGGTPKRRRRRGGRGRSHLEERIERQPSLRRSERARRRSRSRSHGHRHRERRCDKHRDQKDHTKEEESLLSKLDLAEWGIETLCQSGHGGTAQVKEALEILSKLQGIYGARLDTLVDRHSGSSLRADVVALRTELKTLTSRMERLFDPRSRLQDVRACWEEVVAVAPDLATPLPVAYSKGVHLDVIDVTRHVLAGAARVLRATTKKAEEIEAAESRPQATPAEVRAYELFVGSTGLLMEMKKTGAMVWKTGGDPPVLCKPAEIAKKMAQGLDVRNDILLLLAAAARAQMGTQAAREQARKTLDDEIRDAALAASAYIGEDAAQDAANAACATYDNRVLVPAPINLWREVLDLMSRLVAAPQANARACSSSTDSDSSYYTSSESSKDQKEEQLEKKPTKKAAPASKQPEEEEASNSTNSEEESSNEENKEQLAPTKKAGDQRQKPTAAKSNPAKKAAPASKQSEEGAPKQLEEQQEEALKQLEEQPEEVVPKQSEEGAPKQQEEEALKQLEEQPEAPKQPEEAPKQSEEEAFKEKGQPVDVPTEAEKQPAELPTDSNQTKAEETNSDGYSSDSSEA